MSQPTIALIRLETFAMLGGPAPEVAVYNKGPQSKILLEKLVLGCCHPKKQPAT